MVAKYPDLVSCKVRQGFNYTDAHKLWQNIATECNAIPGARKTWKQWKKVCDFMLPHDKQIYKQVFN